MGSHGEQMSDTANLDSGDTFIEQSLWPALAPDRSLGSYTGSEQIDSLASLGITLQGEFKTHYATVKVTRNGVLEQTFDSLAIATTDANGSDKKDYWEFISSPGDNNIQAVKGFIESCKIVWINGHRQIGLRISDGDGTGWDDTLVLVGNIQSIATLPPAVEDILNILEKGRELKTTEEEKLTWWQIEDWWRSKLQDPNYINEVKSYRTIWTPATGAIDAWGLASPQ